MNQSRLLKLHISFWQTLEYIYALNEDCGFYLPLEEHEDIRVGGLQQEKPVPLFIWAPNYCFKTLKNCEAILQADTEKCNGSNLNL